MDKGKKDRRAAARAALKSRHQRQRSETAIATALRNSHRRYIMDSDSSDSDDDIPLQQIEMRCSRSSSSVSSSSIIPAAKIKAKKMKAKKRRLKRPNYEEDSDLDLDTDIDYLEDEIYDDPSPPRKKKSAAATTATNNLDALPNKGMGKKDRRVAARAALKSRRQRSGSVILNSYTSELTSYKPQIENVYEEVDEAEYQTLVESERQKEDFVVVDVPNPYPYNHSSAAKKKTGTGDIRASLARKIQAAAARRPANSTGTAGSRELRDIVCHRNGTAGSQELRDIATAHRKNPFDWKLAPLADLFSDYMIGSFLEYLPPKDVIHMRLVCKRWNDAAKKTLAGVRGFRVDNMENHNDNAIGAISAALPNLHELSVSGFRGRAFGIISNFGMNTISNFRMLRILKIEAASGLRDIPPNVLFRSLQKLIISDCANLRSGLKYMLIGSPSLEELDLKRNHNLTDNIENLRVLKNTLKKVVIRECCNVEGNFMELADFPRLKELLLGTTVSENTRDIGRNDFPSLESIKLLSNCRQRYEFLSVGDVLMRAIHQLSKHSSGAFESGSYDDVFHWRLLERHIDGSPHSRYAVSIERTAFTLRRTHPTLFNFPSLQKLTICGCENLEYDLDILVRSTSLEELNLRRNLRLTGNIKSLRVLKNTLTKVVISECCKVEGNFMELAYFPRLEEMNLLSTNVTGDILDITGNHFPALESIDLPSTVVGGMRHEFQRIDLVPSYMRVIHLLISQRFPRPFAWSSIENALYWKLSKRSPDWYDRGVGDPDPPFSLQIVKSGSRLGWSWCEPNCKMRCGQSCEITWFDPEPSSTNWHDATYVDIYKGYYEPPKEEDYRRVCLGMKERKRRINEERKRRYEEERRRANEVKMRPASPILLLN